MIIFYGLGNNNAKFYKTKHNIGREVVELLAVKLNIEFKRVKNLMVAKNDQIQLLYSCDYMNTSGKFLGEYISFLKPEDYQLYIVHDDSDQIEGNKKMKVGGSSGGHNGINDIHINSKKIGKTSDQIIRLKLGVRPEFNKSKSIDFVLSRYSKKDEELLFNTTNLILENLENLSNNKLSIFQEKFNKS
ncbi:MAG: aminoacyl-tRNA hydrolase [Patescibacteria group bacterium]